MKLLTMLLGATIVAAPAAAQIDYRNLDHGRPTAVEDAYPLERYGLEVSAGYRYLGAPGGAEAPVRAGAALRTGPGGPRGPADAVRRVLGPERYAGRTGRN